MRFDGILLFTACLVILGPFGAQVGYKHIPHSEKPAGVVAKRNARERRRVQTVNQAFVRLSKAVPQSGKASKDNSNF